MKFGKLPSCDRNTDLVRPSQGVVIKRRKFCIYSLFSQIDFPTLFGDRRRPRADFLIFTESDHHLLILKIILLHSPQFFGLTNSTTLCACELLHLSSLPASTFAMRPSRLYFSHLVRRQCPWESTQRENVAQLLHTPKLVQIFPCEKPYKSRYTETVLN